MNSILYLWRTSLKNRLLSLKHHPGQLVVLILLAALLIFCLISAALSPGTESTAAPGNLALLAAILSGLFLFLCVTSIQKGLASGASFFTMADVNLLFLSPVSPRKILAYGLIKRAGTTLLIGVFILFQAANLKSFFGLDTAKIVLLFLGYCLFIFLSELLSLILYAATGGNPRAKGLIKNLLYGCVGLLAAVFVFLAITQGDVMAALVTLLGGKAFQLVPLVGWSTGLIMAAISGDTLWTLLFLGLNLALGGLIIFLVSRTGSNYYEDVLQSAENTYAMKTAAREGRVVETRDTSKISRKKTGIGHGRGASVFFFKHLLENRRSGWLGLNKFTMIFALAAWVLCIFLKDSLDYLWLFGFLCYVQLLSSVTGRWVKETILPYIYLVPQSPFKKLLWASLESLMDGLVGGIIILIPCGLILGETPAMIAAALLARLGMTCLLSADNILVQRLLSSIQSKALLSLLYYLLLFISIIPGIIAAVALGIVTVNLPAALLADAVVNLLLALGFVFACRNVIDVMELNL
ncbi:MAG: putative ABC exporter domain-containing protein [Eubacterium sp.]|nr:putative ABC exporter domain-containing protein [Eubacterium sp.]